MVVDAVDNVQLLREGHEFGGRHLAQFRIAPARERFMRDDVAASRSKIG